MVDANDNAHQPDSIEELIETSRLIICCGPGGVGKTTSAASLALQASFRGRKAAVLTIDPARRLADSLGVSKLSNEPQRVPLGDQLSEETTKRVDPDGELWALMLDQEQTLEDLVRENVPDQKAYERSKNNKIFQLLTSAFHGIERYMALEKLHDLYTGGYFDLVVLDTPPTQNALEFLKTPSRARRFFDRRIMKWFLPDESRSSGFFSRWFNPGSIVLKLLSKLLGESFVDEMSEFFSTFHYLHEIFETRGEMIDFILKDRETDFVVITSPKPRRIREALYFEQELSEMEQRTSAFVVNRVIPSFTESDLDEVDADSLETLVGADQFDPSRLNKLQQKLETHYRSLIKLASRDKEALQQFGRRVGKHLLRAVPLLRRDIHDLEALLRLGDYLTGVASDPLQPKLR